MIDRDFEAKGPGHRAKGPGPDLGLAGKPESLRWALCPGPWSLLSWPDGAG